MFASTTPQALIDDINALTDNDGYSLVSAAQLCAWINNELTSSWGWIGRVNRDLLTKASAQFSMTAGQGTTGISMTAVSPGLALTDYYYPRGVEVLVNASNWKPIRKWSFVTRNQTFSLCYRFIGETMFVNPADQVTNYPFRVWYIYKAPQVSASALSTALVIPENLDEYIKQGVAAKVRIRQDDDPRDHKEAQKDAKIQLISQLRSTGGDQAVIADVDREGVYY